MSLDTARIQRRLPLSGVYPIGMALAAVVLGLMLAALPWQAALALVGGVVILAVGLRWPLAVLALTLLLGPLKAFIEVARPDLAALDPGQIGLAAFLGVWALQRLSQHRLGQRPLGLPWTPVVGLLMAWILVGTLSLWGAADPVDGLKEVVKWGQMLVLVLVVADMATGDAAGRARLGWLVAVVLLAGMAQAGIGLWEFMLRGHGPEHFAIGPGRFRAYGTFEQPNPFGGFMGMVWPLAAGVGIGWLQQAFSLLFSRSEGKGMTFFHPRPHKTQRPLFSPSQGEMPRSGRGGGSLGGARQMPYRPQDSPKASPHLSVMWLVWLPGSLAVAALSGAALLASYSRGAWLGAAAAAGALLLFWPRSRWLGIGLGVVALLGGLSLAQVGLLPASVTARLADVGDFVQVYDVRGIHINDSNFSLIERIAHWQAAFNMADAHPWLGVGLGNYGAAYADFRLVNWKEPLGHAHNIYFNLLAETGLLGLATYLLVWLGIAGLTIRALGQHTGWRRGLALGMLGVWAHLAAHHLVDNLYVNNLHLYLGVLFGLLGTLLMLPVAPSSKVIHYASINPTDTKQ